MGLITYKQIKMGCCATNTVGLENDNNTDNSLSEDLNKVSFADITIFSDSEQVECKKAANTEGVDWVKSPRFRSTSCHSAQHRNLEFAFLMSPSLYTDRPVIKSSIENSSTGPREFPSFNN